MVLLVAAETFVSVRGLCLPSVAVKEVGHALVTFVVLVVVSMICKALILLSVIVEVYRLQSSDEPVHGGSFVSIVVLCHVSDYHSEDSCILDVVTIFVIVNIFQQYL